MQVPASPGVAEEVDQLIAEAAPGRRGIAAWLALRWGIAGHANTGGDIAPLARQALTGGC